MPAASLRSVIEHGSHHMVRALVKGVIIGTLIFVFLLGLALLGFRPAFELAIWLSIPIIYAVGPAFNLLSFESLEGPPGSVAIIFISSWLELVVIVTFVTTILFRLRLSNPAFKRCALKRTP